MRATGYITEGPDVTPGMKLAMQYFNSTVGMEFDFHGVDNNCFKLDNAVWEALEDPDDGYRSYLGVINLRDVGNLTFFRTPVARVTLVEVDHERGLCGYRLIDVKDRHMWLEFGTDHSDDYYPWFNFYYQPRRPR